MDEYKKKLEKIILSSIFSGTLALSSACGVGRGLSDLVRTQRVPDTSYAGTLEPRRLKAYQPMSLNDLPENVADYLKKNPDCIKYSLKDKEGNIEAILLDKNNDSYTINFDEEYAKTPEGARWKKNGRIIDPELLKRIGYSPGMNIVVIEGECTNPEGWNYLEIGAGYAPEGKKFIGRREGDKVYIKLVDEFFKEGGNGSKAGSGGPGKSGGGTRGRSSGRGRG